MKNRGLTIVELLIAIAVIGLAFSALLSSQLFSLRTSAQARYASDAKAFAVEVLERKSAEVLRVETVPPTSPYLDEEDTGRSFFFIDYYYNCPTPVTLPPGSGIRRRSDSDIPILRRVECRGTEVHPSGIQADWAILGESSAPNSWGVRAEGVVTLVVTARHLQGPQVTVGRRVTCYDVYPSPTHDKPQPCPEPGGGRP